MYMQNIRREVFYINKHIHSVQKKRNDSEVLKVGDHLGVIAKKC